MEGLTPAPHYGGPLVRSAVAIIPFALIAVIAISLPKLQCPPDAETALECAAPATQRASTPPAEPTDAAAEAAPSGSAAHTGPAEPAAPADLIRATFDTVPALPGAPAAPTEANPTLTAALQNDLAAVSATEPATAEPASETIPIRVVTTVPVRLGYAPEQPAGTPAAPTSAAAAVQQAGGGVAAPSQAAAPQDDATWMRVDADRLNVRAEPSVASTRLFTLQSGQQVEARSRNGQWVEIADGGGRVGWVHADYLAEPGAAPVSEASADAAGGKPATVMIVDGAGVNVRSAPSMRGNKLFALPAGERVTVSDTRRGWLHVTDSEGRTGWSYSTYLYEAGDA